MQRWYARPVLLAAFVFVLIGTLVSPVEIAHAAGLTVSAPKSVSISSAGIAGFGVKTNGDPATTTFTWEVSRDRGVSWEPIGVDLSVTLCDCGSSITVKSPPVSHSGYQYRVTVVDGGETVTSEPATLTVKPFWTPPGTKDPDPVTPDPGTQDPGTQDPGTGTNDPDPGTKAPDPNDTGTPTPDPGAPDPTIPDPTVPDPGPVDPDPVDPDPVDPAPVDPGAPGPVDPNLSSPQTPAPFGVAPKTSPPSGPAPNHPNAGARLLDRPAEMSPGAPHDLDSGLRSLARTGAPARSGQAVAGALGLLLLGGAIMRSRGAAPHRTS